MKSLKWYQLLSRDFISLPKNKKTKKKKRFSRQERAGLQETKYEFQITVELELLFNCMDC